LNPEDQAVFEYALRGKDWNVYWLLLKNGRLMSAHAKESKYPSSM
jgi:hypothetical protein